MNSGGPVIAVPAPGDDSGRGHVVDVPHWVETRSPQEICTAHASPFVPPSPLDKVAVALNTLEHQPLNARRITPERGICGWYIWGGKGGRHARAAGFFETLPVAHLLERCPQIMPFLALGPGWRVSLGVHGPEILPPHDGAPPPNVAARRIGGTTSRTPPVKQWVWLSIVLHILAVVLFGDTTDGARTGQSRGARAGGPLTVTLQRGAQDSAETLALRPETKLGSLEKSLEQSDKPRATRSNRTRRTPPASDAAPVEAISPTPANTTEIEPAMPRVIAADVEKPVTDFVVPRAIPEPVKSPPAPPEPPAARLPESLPKLDSLPAPKAIVTPEPEREIALPPELIPRLVPLAPARSERATPLQTAPRAKTFVPPKVEPEPAPVPPPVALPRMTPLAPLAPPVPTPIERSNARSPDLLPRLPPVAPAATIETVKPTDVVPRVTQTITDPVVEKPATVEKISVPPVAANPTPTPTAAPPTANVAPAAASPTTATTSPPASRTITGPTGGAADSALAPAPRAPIAGPSTSGAAPRIDLDAVRQRAREIGREGAGPRTLLPFNVKPKEDTRTKEQQAFDKALKRTDCRDAYANMGLAAVVPLLLDSVSEKGCKW